jgi:transposase
LKGGEIVSKTKRNRYSSEFKAKVALEALRGERTISELGAKYGVHPNMITQWKRQAVEGLSGVFTGKSNGRDKGHEAEVKELHAKIGQLTVERDFLAKAFGR